MSSNPNRKHEQQARDRAAYRRRRDRGHQHPPPPLHHITAGDRTYAAVEIIPDVLYAVPSRVAETIAGLVMDERCDLIRQIPPAVLATYPPRCPCCGDRMTLPYMGPDHAEYERLIRPDEPAAKWGVG